MDFKTLNEHLEQFLERGGSDYGTMKDNFASYFTDKYLTEDLETTLKVYASAYWIFTSMDEEIDTETELKNKKQAHIFDAAYKTLEPMVSEYRGFLAAIIDLINDDPKFYELFNVDGQEGAFTRYTIAGIIEVITKNLPSVVLSSRAAFERLVERLIHNDDGNFRANRQITISNLKKAFNSDMNKLDRMIKMVSAEWPNGYNTVNPDKVDPILTKLLNCKDWTEFDTKVLQGKTIADVVVPYIKGDFLTEKDLVHILGIDGGADNSLFPSNWDVKKFGEYPVRLAQALVQYNFRMEQDGTDIFTDVYNVYYANRDKKAFANALKVWKDAVLTHDIYVYEEIEDDEVAAQMYALLQHYEPYLVESIFKYMPSENVEEIKQNWENN